MRAKEMTRNRWAAATVFALYILLLFYLLFFSELNGRGLMNRSHISYNLQPFREIKRYIFHWKQIGLLSSLLNLFGNIIGFAPLGFLLPSFSGRCRRYWYNTLMAGYLLSFAVELFQLIFRAGSCDIDDIILNTLGTAFGYLLFILVQRRREKRRKKETAQAEIQKEHFL